MPDQALKGILLVNLGTPRSYHLKDVYRYLTEFLTDGRVIDFPWLKRQLLVRGLIIPARVRQSALSYRQLWAKTQGSPLLLQGRAVQQALQRALGEGFKVVLSMRYQFPSLSEGLEELRGAQVEDILILPLFPQYASSTTGSVHQKVMEIVSTWQTIPKLTFINDYFDHPAVIAAFCARGRQYPLESYDHILFSFHGLPERQIRKGDLQGSCFSSGCCEHLTCHNRFCYRAQCHAMTRAIAQQLGFERGRYTFCFQSRLGKDPWLRPYVTDVLEECLSKGYKRLLVFCPSFVADCLETLIEIQQDYQQEFKKKGERSCN